MENKNTVKNFVILALGSMIVSCAIYFFKIPNNFLTGGFSGLGMILGVYIKNISTSTIIWIINVVFLVIGWIILGRSIGIRTIYCTLVYSCFLELLDLLKLDEKVGVPFTNDILLELIFACLLEAIGLAIVIKNGGSTGGTVIVALIVRKLAKLDIGSAMIYADIVIVGATFFIFDVKTGMYSLLGLLIKSLGLKYFTDMFNNRKTLMIVTKCPDEILRYITETIHGTATIWEGKGAFEGDGRTVIFAVMTAKQSTKATAFAKKTDSEVFIVKNSSHEIYGRHFMGINE